MKKALTLVVLAMVVPAMAEIQLFWSWSGINDPSLQYSTALTNFLPAFVPWTGPVTEVDTPDVDLFLWGRFIETPTMPSYTQIYGLDLKFEGAGEFVQSVAYRHNKTGSGAYKRWDGANPILLNGVMAAVTARGIEFLYQPDTNNDLSIKYDASTGYSDFLIGAAKLHFNALGDVATVSLDTADGLGIAMREIQGPDIPDPPVLAASVTYIPEPASMLLLGLAGLLIRRR